VGTAAVGRRARIAFYAYRSGNRDVWTKPAGCDARAERLATDGARLYFTRGEELGNVWTTTGLSAPSSLTCRQSTAMGVD